MKENKYMAEVQINDLTSFFTYTAPSKEEAERKLKEFYKVTENKNTKVKLYDIWFDGNYYYDKETGRRFDEFYEQSINRQNNQ